MNVRVKTLYTLACLNTCAYDQYRECFKSINVFPLWFKFPRVRTPSYDKVCITKMKSYRQTNLISYRATLSECHSLLKPNGTFSVDLISHADDTFQH